MNHYLFVGHDASRTGAPIVLLHLLRWLKQKQLCTFSVLLINGGELEHEYSCLADTYIWNLPTTSNASLVNRIAFKLSDKIINSQKKHEKDIIGKVHNQGVKAIYGNTVVSTDVIVELKQKLKCPVVCHVHELEMAIERYFGTERFRKQVPNIDLIIAASEAVRKNIISTFGFPAEKTVKVHEFVPSPNRVLHESGLASIREELTIPLGSYVVAASGTLDWRKAPDIFVQVADYIKCNYQMMPYFIWIGGSKSTIEWLELEYDLKRLGLLEYVKFIGSKSNPLDYLRVADVFILTSREDPYPLVCLEAASLGKPVICFDDAGGMPEFVGADCGIVVPYLAVANMALAIIKLFEQPELRNALGKRAFEKVTTQHNVELTVHQIMEHLDNL